MKVKIDKSLAASIALHVLVLGWGLISFSARSYEVPQDSLTVDVISADQLAKITTGIRNGEKDKPKPLVEKVAEAKPVDEAIGKVTDKQEIVTSTAPPPPPKQVEKPVEKKPDPKPVAEDKPKDEPKQAERKPDPPKIDPIAEALKKADEHKKPKPKQQAKAAPPKPQKPKQEHVFNEAKIAALLDKRDPDHQALTGAALNASASLGLHSGNAQTNVATWKGAFVAAVRRCFNFPYNGQDADQFEADIDIYMRPDGTLASEPTIVAVRGPVKSIGDAMAESAKRAIVQCQAYAFLPKEQYNTWKYIPMTFGLKDML